MPYAGSYRGVIIVVGLDTVYVQREGYQGTELSRAKWDDFIAAYNTADDWSKWREVPFAPDSALTDEQVRYLYEWYIMEGSGFPFGQEATNAIPQ